MRSSPSLPERTVSIANRLASSKWSRYAIINFTFRSSVTRIIACCGKVYYDLLSSRREQRHDNVAVIRVEQLYPFPHKPFAAEMKKYPNAHEVVCCQEEPQNQGAWYQSAHYFRENMREDQKLYYAGRPPAASPAGGYVARHNERQKALVEQAFGKYT